MGDAVLSSYPCREYEFAPRFSEVLRAMKCNNLCTFVFAFLLALAALFPGAGKACADGITIRILHTSDTHSHFEPTADHLGGVARRRELVREIRRQGGNVLLVDAGDVFRGTLYFFEYRGEACAWVMNRIGYDAMAVGEHEFDLGDSALAQFAGEARFPLLAANLGVPASSPLSGKVLPYVVKEFGGQKVGIFGLITPDVMRANRLPGFSVGDPVAAANQTVAGLRSQGVNKVVLLSHLGYERDKALAASVQGIDVIVGGHSHTLLGNLPGSAGPYPTVVRSPSGDQVLVVASGKWGEYLGDLSVTFDDAGRVSAYSGGLYPLDSGVRHDREMSGMVKRFKAPIAGFEHTSIGVSSEMLDGSYYHIRKHETNLGDVIADAMRWKMASDGVQVALINSGAVRASIQAGDVFPWQVLSALPYGDEIVDMNLTGTQLLEALEIGVGQRGYGSAARFLVRAGSGAGVHGLARLLYAPSGRFPQVSGLRFWWNPRQPSGARIVDVQVWNGTRYEPIDPAATYRVAVNSYIAQGNDGYSVLTRGTDVYHTEIPMTDAVIEYVRSQGNLRVEMGRIYSTYGTTSIPEASTKWMVIAGLLVILVYSTVWGFRKWRETE